MEKTTPDPLTIAEVLRNAASKFRLEDGDRYSISMRDANKLVAYCREAAIALLQKSEDRP